MYNIFDPPGVREGRQNNDIERHRSRKVHGTLGDVTRPTDLKAMNGSSRIGAKRHDVKVCSGYDGFWLRTLRVGSESSETASVSVRDLW